MKHCDCTYQKANHNWGYEIQKWIGGKKSWKFVTNVTKIQECRLAEQQIPYVLIRCRGCGSELIRKSP